VSHRGFARVLSQPAGLAPISNQKVL